MSNTDKNAVDISSKRTNRANDLITGFSIFNDWNQRTNPNQFPLCKGMKTERNRTKWTKYTQKLRSIWISILKCNQFTIFNSFIICIWTFLEHVLPRLQFEWNNLSFFFFSFTNFDLVFGTYTHNLCSLNECIIHSIFGITELNSNEKGRSFGISDLNNSLKKKLSHGNNLVPRKLFVEWFVLLKLSKMSRT